jgi:uncharacterized protein
MFDLDGLEVLSEDECRRLLTLGSLGRIGISTGSGPAIFPVNYIVAASDILFFTAEGTKLHAATANTVATLEVDHFNPVTRTGWSVMAVGSVRERTEPSVVRGAMAAGLEPWAPGDRSHLVALGTELLTGRRIAPHAGAVVSDEPVVGPASRVAAIRRPALRVGIDWTLQETAAAMFAAGASCALVGYDQAIVTERDLARALTAGLGARAGVVSVAVTDFVTVDDDTSVVEAAGVMLDNDVRHLVVRNHRGDVTGLISLRDMLRVLVDTMDPAIWVILRHRLSIRREPA